MKISRGLFVVLEGLDGSGTTTQAAILQSHLTGSGQQVHLTREPTDEPVGRLIREAISGQLVSASSGEAVAFSERALCLLFAADRIEHSGKVERLRAAGMRIICDRYILSSIAYQSLDPDISPQRVVEVNEGCSRPDVTFLLEVPVEECLRRLERRSDSATVYEKEELLTKIDRNYRSAASLYEANFGPLIVIDGTQTVDAVHADITKQLEGFLQD